MHSIRKSTRASKAIVRVLKFQRYLGGNVSYEYHKRCNAENMEGVVRKRITPLSTIFQLYH